jgi:hypothetical protein
MEAQSTDDAERYSVQLELAERDEVRITRRGERDFSVVARSRSGKLEIHVDREALVSISQRDSGLVLQVSRFSSDFAQKDQTTDDRRRSFSRAEREKLYAMAIALAGPTTAPSEFRSLCFALLGSEAESRRALEV